MHPIVWETVLSRCGALIPLLMEVHLHLTAPKAALAIGLRDAKALRTELRRRRLPPFQDLRDWIYVVQLLERHANGEPIARFAMRRGSYPHQYYRLVGRVTGLSWARVSELGVHWARQRALTIWNGDHACERTFAARLT